MGLGGIAMGLGAPLWVWGVPMGLWEHPYGSGSIPMGLGCPYEFGVIPYRSLGFRGSPVGLEEGFLWGCGHGEGLGAL